MFERIVIKEIHKNSGEKMRVLFDLNSQGGLRNPGMENCESLTRDVNMRNLNKRCVTPTNCTGNNYYINRNLKWKSPRILCKTPDSLMSNTKGTEEQKKKRNISEELLDGIDKEMRLNRKFRLAQPGKLKFFHNKARPKLVLHNRISFFDKTVPDCIIIESKSPIINK